ncbi:lamin tail domain-containing protein [Haloplanus sp. C73]|uniref:lamin tail domain-containing protein n=1 Tax=Haloplanus sp. C73 TaxID=3421641 RepID=UPI003EBD21A9
MLSLIALAVALVLVASAVAAARVDALDYRVALVAVAVALAVGGATAQVAPTESPASAVDAATGSDDPTRLAAATAPNPTATGNATANGTNATVLGIGDGGRLTYRTAGGDQQTVRLAGLDVPSAGGADPARFDGVLTGSRGRTCLAQQGRRALIETRTRLVGESVSVQSVDADGATVRVDGRSLNRQLVERGAARATGETYADAERSARSARLGVWSCAVVEPTSPLREANTSNVRIDTVHPNPPGDDAASLTDEYVVIENAGERTVDLSDWYLIADENYYFFGDRTLRPGEELVVRVGSGQDAAGVVYWGAPRPILDNDHDTLKLVDGDTDRTVRVTY